MENRSLFVLSLGPMTLSTVTLGCVCEEQRRRRCMSPHCVGTTWSGRSLPFLLHQLQLPWQPALTRAGPTQTSPNNAGPQAPPATEIRKPQHRSRTLTPHVLWLPTVLRKGAHPHSNLMHSRVCSETYLMRVQSPELFPDLFLSQLYLGAAVCQKIRHPQQSFCSFD